MRKILGPISGYYVLACAAPSAYGRHTGSYGVYVRHPDSACADAVVASGVTRCEPDARGAADSALAAGVQEVLRIVHLLVTAGAPPRRFMGSLESSD
jgi:hypothetical protein